ncbi:hybrid sensor histidine kinase/response regulator transcription factor [Dyadobacter endophyticus]|nr:two-component regulator propeller domain-containing protein [Dyadobacter endophyticus]
MERSNMIAKVARRGAWLMVFMAAWAAVNAQRATENFKFDHLTVNDGLAHSDAMAVTQDRQGFVWVGTNNGINRYDGYQLSTYNLPAVNAAGTSANRVQVMHVDGAGRIWAGTEGSGIYFYQADKDEFVSIQEAFSDQVGASYRRLVCQTSIRSMASDRIGNLWVATADFGVVKVCFDDSRRIAAVSQIPLTSARAYHALNVLPDTSGHIWIGTMGRGLWVLAPGARSAVAVATLSEPDIRATYQDESGRVWIASDQYLYQCKRTGHAITFERMPYNFHGIQCISSDSYRRLWIGTNFGLVMLRHVPDDLQSLSATDFKVFLPDENAVGSINSSRVHQVAQDSFGNLWLAASSGGLNRLHLNPKPFGHLYRQKGVTSLANNYVNAIAKDEYSGLIWLGTRNGLSIYDPATAKYQNLMHRSAGGSNSGVDVSAILITDRYAWVSTRYAGLHLVDRQNGFKIIRTLKTDPYPSSYVSIERLAEDAKHRVWASGVGAGLFLYNSDGALIANFNKNNSLIPTDECSYVICEPGSDVIWVSTRNAGVLQLRLDGNKLVILAHFKHEPGNGNSLKVNYAWPLLRDQDGSVWVGTIGRGLHCIRRKGGKTVVERYDGQVAANDIESILKDSEGNLWLGSDGLYKFNPATRGVWHYRVGDGLQSNSFKIGSAFNAKDRTMYFGGTNGVTFFDPEDIASNPTPPVVRITGLSVLNKGTGGGEQMGTSMVRRPFNSPEGAEIRASENEFSIGFVGLSYLTPEKQRYAFMLENFHSDWVYLPTNQRIVSFANLPAGEYVFKVRASNGDGVWSAEPATLRIRILPPWYLSWWAYGIYLVMAVGALLLYKWVATSRIKLKNKLEIQQLQVEKEKEIAAMRTQFFTSVSHEFRTPLTLILGPMEEFIASMSGSESMKEKVTLMHRQTRKLLDLVNQLLSFKKAESGYVSLAASEQEATGFITEIYQIFAAKARECSIDYVFEVPDHPVSLFFDPHKLEIILTNLLSNAFKYTPPNGRVKLQVSLYGQPERDAVWSGREIVDNYLEMTVSDSGSGIAGGELDKIFDPYYQAAHTGPDMVGTGIGLALVKELAQAHHGEVTVLSEVGKGSAFTVKLPFGSAHLTDAEIAHERPAEPLNTRQEPDIAAGPASMAGQGGKLLVVEDNEDLAEYLKGVFQGHYQVTLVGDGASAWELMEDLQPDLVLSDIMMPGLNGLQLCEKIKHNPKTAHIPVVLLTARAAAVQELEGLSTGADDYVVKPFNVQLLSAKIRTLLRNRDISRDFYQRQILLQPASIAIPDEERLFLEKAMKIVETNLTNPEFNVQALVSQMAMSQSVFYRRIKSLTGQSVIEFIKDIRLKRAAQLLKSPHMRISEVAFLVGIEDPKNFRVSFQKLYGSSPSRYAKLHGESSQEAKGGYPDHAAAEKDEWD